MVASDISIKRLRGEADRYRRPANPREAAILAAATRLFGARGYAGTRTAEIAAQAKVTERTLFKYFPSKKALYRRVMFPALLSAAVPRTLIDAGRLFGTDRESFAKWHREILALRLDAALASAPQLRLLLAGLMTDEAMRAKVLDLWKANVWKPLLVSMRRFQKRGQIRRNVRPETVARAVISLNLGYIIARALLSDDARGWEDSAEIDATVALLLAGISP